MHLQDLSDHVKHLTELLDNQLIINQKLQENYEVCEFDYERKNQSLRLIFDYFSTSYLEIGDANSRGALWTFKQQLVSEMWVRGGISNLLL